VFKATRRPDAKRQAQTKVKRFYTVFGLFVFLAVLVFGKLLYLQVIDSGNLKQKARQLRNPSLVLYNRGRILDRRGVILAQDTLLYDVYAHPRYYWKAKPKQIAQALSPILNIPYHKLATKLSEPEATIGVVKNLHKAIIDRILEARITLPRLDAKTKQPILGENGEVLTSHIPIQSLVWIFLVKPFEIIPKARWLLIF
jgi:cell division protein FtsI (penicillin-binding protein 3)